MASCEKEGVSGGDEKTKRASRGRPASAKRQSGCLHGSGRRLSNPARLWRRQLSGIAAALEVQQGCLLKVLESQDRHEAVLQSQAKWIVRQVGGMVRSKLCQGLHGGQLEPERQWSASARGATTGKCASWTTETDASPAASADRRLTGSLGSEASPAPSRISVPASPMASLSDFSFLTLPEELHKLEDKLNTLKESDKSFFFWGLTNSDDSQRREERSTLGALAYKCTHSVLFETLVPIFIIGNACTIGYQADWDMRHYGEKAGSENLLLWIWTNRVFALVFLLEIVLRIASDGLCFFDWRIKGFGWNAFDSLIVASSIAEEVAALAFATRLTRMSSVRVVRLLRLVRALRVIRVLRFFRELRIMVLGIMNCGKSLLWASLLITIMTYTFSVVFLQASFAYLEDTENERVNGMTANVDCRYEGSPEYTIRKNFHSLVGGMYTLFKAMSGGSSWGEISDYLTEISPLVTFAFCVYIMLAVFVVLNVITAIFVDSSQRVSDDEATRILDNIQRKSSWIRNAKELFRILDTRNEGELQWGDISRLFTDERAQSCLQEFGIDLEFQSAQVLFSLFDASGTGRVSEDSFARTLYRLQGGARSLDLCRIHSTVASMHRSLKLANKRVDALASQLGLGVDRKAGADHKKA